MRPERSRRRGLWWLAALFSVVLLALSVVTTAQAESAVVLKDDVPATYTSLRNVDNGSVAKEVGETGLAQRLPRWTNIDQNTGKVLVEYIPDVYVGTYAVSGDSGVIADASFKIGSWNGNDGYRGYPCLEFDYTVAGAGTATVTLTYYYHYDDVPNSPWYQETMTFSVVGTNPATDWSGMTITKCADKAEAEPGDSVVYTITVKNETGGKVTYCTLTDTLPGSLSANLDDSTTGATQSGQVVSWTFNEGLENGAEKTFVLAAKVNDDAGSGTLVQNSAKVYAKGADGTYQTTVTPEPAKTTIVAKSTTYTLTYDANGGEGAPEVQTTTSREGWASLVVSNGIPTREGYVFLGWAETQDATEAVYKAGDSVTLKADNPTKKFYAVWEFDWSKLSITNTIVSPTDSTTVEVGDTITYRIAVTNNTGQRLSNVFVTDLIDTDMFEITSTRFFDSSDDYNKKGDGSWRLWTVPAGRTHWIEITVKAKKAGTFTNTAKVSQANLTSSPSVAVGGKGAEASAAEVTVVEIDWSKLSITNTIVSPTDSTTVQVGEEVTYRIAVTNGTGHTFRNVFVTDLIDTDMFEITSTRFFDSSDDYNKKGDGSWRLWTVPAGRTHWVEITVKAVKTGEFTNTVTFGQGNLDGAPSISIVDKVAEASAPTVTVTNVQTVVWEGETFTFDPDAVPTPSTEETPGKLNDVTTSVGTTRSKQLQALSPYWRVYDVYEDLTPVYNSWHNGFQYLALEYAGARVTSSNPDVVDGGTFKLGAWTGSTETGSPCLQFDYTAKAAGTSTITIDFYFNYDVDAHIEEDDTWGTIYVPAHTEWYHRTVSYNVTVQ